MSIREQYREAWRQARLLKGMIKRDQRERNDCFAVYNSAIKLHRIEQGIAWDTRQQLNTRDTFLGDPMRHCICYQHRQTGIPTASDIRRTFKRYSLRRAMLADPKRDWYDDMTFSDRYSRQEL